MGKVVSFQIRSAHVIGDKQRTVKKVEPPILVNGRYEFIYEFGGGEPSVINVACQNGTDYKNIGAELRVCFSRFAEEFLNTPYLEVVAHPNFMPIYDLIRWMMRHMGIGEVRLQRSTTPLYRNENIERFEVTKEHQFLCPNCGGFRWGTSLNDRRDFSKATGHCHDCLDFKWSRSDDYLYFVKR